MPKSTAQKSPRKVPKSRVEKPYSDFPLTAHRGANQWCKKYRGKQYYFGTLDDPAAALKEFNFAWPYIINGEPIPDGQDSDGCSLKTVVDCFLSAKEDKLESGELSPRTFRIYYETCARMVDHFGLDRLVKTLGPDSWRTYRDALSKRYSKTTLKNEINRVKVIFNFAWQDQLIEKPIVWGQGFDMPSAKELRRHRNEGGQKLFTREEILQILSQCDTPMRAMVLLGINCGFGNTDCANLPRTSVDLENGWIEFPRPKTEIERRIPLWSETAEAVKAAIATRPNPADKAHENLCFLTRQGRQWVRTAKKKRKPKKTANGKEGDNKLKAETELLVAFDSLTQKFRKILKDLKINGRRGLGFYSCRHVFQTIADESKDPVAVSAIMGHSDNSMSANYRHGVSDERLRAVVNCVHDWLWPADDQDEDAAEGGVK